MAPPHIATSVAFTAIVLVGVAAGGMPAQAAQPAQGGRARVVAPPAKPAAADTGLAMGAFVSSRIDDKKLPMRDLATDSIGTKYLIEFDELVLTVKTGGEFRATLRYRQTLSRKGEATSQEPIQRMSVYGTWIREGASIRFIPDPRRGGEGLRILAGTHTAKTITVPFDYQNGKVTRRSTVLLVFDPTIF